MKKCIFLMLVLTMVINLAFISCAESYLYKNEARFFFESGIFHYAFYGETTNGEDSLDIALKNSLKDSLSREDAIILTLKLFGKNQDAENLSQEEADKILNVFIDRNKISPYAFKSVALSVKLNITSGKININKKQRLIDPKKTVLGKEFATSIIKHLGYTNFQFHKACEFLSSIDGSNLDKNIARKYENKYLNKDYAFGFMYGSLTAKLNNTDVILFNELKRLGIVEKDKLLEGNS